MNRIYFLLILCVLFWSGNFVVGRYIHAEIESLQLAFFRWLSVFLLMSPVIFLHRKNIFQTLKKHFLFLNLLAILGISTFNTLLYQGLHFTTSTNALLINSSIPIIIIIFSFIILKTPIVAHQIIGIFLSTFGVGYLIIKGDFAILQNLTFNQGDFWIIASSLTWAMYSVLIKLRPKELNDVEFFVTLVLLGTFWLFIAYTYAGFKITTDIGLYFSNIWVFAYISIFASILSFFFWHKGIHELGANKTGQFTHLMPLFGSILAYIFLKEHLYMYHILGAVFIALGIYLSLFYKGKLQKGNK